MASTRVLGVGVGLFILSALWFVALFMCIAFSRAHGAISNVGLVSVLLTAFVTLILLVLPKEPQFPTEEDLTIIYDYSIIYRSLLIAGCALFLLIGLIIYLINYLMEPVYAKQLRRIRT